MQTAGVGTAGERGWREERRRAGGAQVRRRAGTDCGSAGAVHVAHGDGGQAGAWVWQAYEDSC